jgi:hypothetical protein
LSTVRRHCSGSTGTRRFHARASERRLDATLSH